MNAAHARRELVRGLQLAASGEWGAIRAYLGHRVSLPPGPDRQTIREILGDEIRHRRLVIEMLGELGARPDPRSERKLNVVGGLIAAFCRVGGRFLPMVGAARLECDNIVEYEILARLAHVAGLPALVDQPWIGFDDDHSYMPGHQWLHERLGRRPEIRVNNWLVLHDAVRVGTGLAVLPCYLGDQDTALRRVGDLLPEVSTEQWLLVHRDLRALPRVRAVMDALVELFQRHRSVLEGRGPTSP